MKTCCHGYLQTMAKYWLGYQGTGLG